MQIVGSCYDWGVQMHLIALFLILLILPAATLACGGESRCEVRGGYYLAAAPAGWDGKTPLPLVVYFHGWNGSPEGTFRNRGMVRGVTDRGALFVAPYAQTGYWRQIGNDRAERGRDEAVYIRAVIEDVRHRWPIDQHQTLASGFSRGASMVWNVACYTGDLFRAYAPIAGGFWRSNPETCPTGPVNLRHIHGLSDRVVAFDKVGIYNSMPIPEGFDILARLNGVSGESHAVESGDQRLTCKRWDQSESGRVLELCLHERGHSIPAEWVGQGLDWLMNLPEGS
ncbi:Alpha/beta hydrolase family protein [Roseovarius aestuarii]|uniref:Alpha/beta hydrolase family protein n=2 Tax=Roseovarius aestuarii TaxID=475083 RepID=A0A1X7BW14_9RHOB|nr:Alpha/beta hydrolase family protein [Roseovarius aestuarii]